MLKTHLKDLLFPITTLAQITIGFYYALQHQSQLKKRLVEKKPLNSPILKGNPVSDFFGSPETSPVSLLSYYLAGAYSQQRLAFITYEIYACLYHCVPPKTPYILPSATIIPYFYPYFKNKKIKKNAYTRCHQALYESCTAFLLRKKTHPLLHDSLRTAATYYKKECFTKRCQRSLDTLQQKICLDFQVILYLSKKQVAVYSSVQTTFQLTIPWDDALSWRPNAFEGVVGLITQLKPERVVIHQKYANLITHQSALALAVAIHKLLPNTDDDFKLRSLAYHNENPKDPVPELSSFYSLFTEICTMGYQNPNNKDKKMSSKSFPAFKGQANQKYFIESHEQHLPQLSRWSKTTISHTNLKRPTVQWEYLKNTVVALFLHEFFFQACHSAAECASSAYKSKKPMQLLKALWACFGLLSIRTWLTHVFLLPVRIGFVLSSASYLYYTKSSDTLFDVTKRSHHSNMIELDAFSIKEVFEDVFIYDKNELSPQLSPLILSDSPKSQKRPHKL